MDFKRIEELLNLPKNLSIPLFDEFLMEFANTKVDPKVAIEELDRILALLQNHALTLSLHLKQKYLLSHTHKPLPRDAVYFTKQELANKYRVSVRTVTNWITDGLEAEEIGGIKRISLLAIGNFQKSQKGKKFNWRSIKR